MNISSLFNSNIAMGGFDAYGSSSTAATGGVNAAGLALQKADQRVQSQLDATSAQLSAFGKLKSALSDAQLAGRALGSITASSSDSTVTSALAQFISKYNAAISTAGSTAALPGNGAQASAAARAGNDLKRALSANLGTLDSLRKLGFSQQSDGTLTLDTAKLGAARKADAAGTLAGLAKLGQLVDTAAGKELAGNGNVDVSMTMLTQRSTSLQSQHKALVTTLQGLGMPISLNPVADEKS